MLILMLLTSIVYAKAQNYLLMHIEDITSPNYEFCLQDYDSIVIVDTTCNEYYNEHWQLVVYNTSYYLHELGPVLTLFPNDESYDFLVIYRSCEGNGVSFSIRFYGFNAPEPWFPEYVWKHGDETITLTAPENYDIYYGPYRWNYEWSTGESEKEIEVLDPGYYWARLYNLCGEAIDSIDVRNCIEMDLVTTDLVTNLNQIHWTVSETTSSYVSEVNVYRNNHFVGTVPYAEGTFLDSIGNEATQWQYHIVGVTPEGEECPINSYWTRPIHLDYLQGQVNHTLQWTSYETENNSPVLAYRIFDVVGSELRLVEEVGNFAHVYNYNPSVFVGDAVVAAVLSSGELAFSNRVSPHLGIEETSGYLCYVYPNPTDGIITVSGLQSGAYRITNIVGQTVLTGSIDDDNQRIDVSALPKGMYFITVGDTTRKFVVK